jgi:hypothetical protein
MTQKAVPKKQEGERSKAPVWPPFFEMLPRAELTVQGLEGRMLRCDAWLVLFMHADREVVVPRHHHGAQWGMVLDGQMELSIGDEQHAYRRGDSHFIPDGVEHEATLHAGWKGIYVFARRS